MSRGQPWPTVVFWGAAVLAFLGGPGQAQTLQRLTSLPYPRMGVPTMTSDGQTILAVTNRDLLGTQSAREFQVFAIDSFTGTPTQVTHVPGGLHHAGRDLAISADGSTIAFMSTGDLTGDNPDRSVEIFVMQGDDLTQVTDDPRPNAGAVDSLALAPGGSRVVFLSTSDPLGTNPDGQRQVFVAETDGSGVTQLTASTAGEPDEVDIDGAGERVVFVHPADLTGAGVGSRSYLYGIRHDGTGLRLLRAGSGGPTGYPQAARISAAGDVVIVDNEAPTHGSRVHRLDWDGNELGQQHGRRPALSLDGTRVFLAADSSIYPQLRWWDPSTSGVVLEEYTHQSLILYGDIATSDSGDRVAFIREFRDNLNDSASLWAGRHDGMPVELDNWPLRAAAVGSPDTAVIAHDGSRITFVTNTGRLFVMNSDGTDLRQLPTQRVERATISPDGETIYFVRRFVGTVFAIGADGSDERAIAGSSAPPRIAADGSTIVFQTAGDVVAANPEGDAQRVLGAGESPRIDATGTWVAFHDAGAVYRVSADGAGLPVAISAGNEQATDPDISLDGRWVAYIAQGDPLGSNPDLGAEIFFYDAATGTTRQLTETAGHEFSQVRIDPTARWVYFVAHTRLDEDDPDSFAQIFRVDVESRAVQRWFGLGFGHTPTPRRIGCFGCTRFVPLPVVELDGAGRAVFAAAGDLDGTNPDRSPQVWLADPAAPNPLQVSGAAPTRLTWQPEPGFLRYDVVRGDLSALREGAGLGAVVCLLDDTPVPTTAGGEDLDDPGEEQGFFYVYRGAFGLDLGNGTYGFASTGLERLPGRGDCSP